jgi:hypothetical protein
VSFTLTLRELLSDAKNKIDFSFHAIGAMDNALHLLINLTLEILTAGYGIDLIT